MCGIFGVFVQDKKSVLSKELFEEPLRLIHHRGPNAKGIEIIDSHIGLGHTRLSILDLSAHANQPFTFEQLTLSFNGEIYNYVEIREDLISKGYVFHTSSDTEVLLKAFHCWGKDCLTKFNGMWAFAIYDRDKDELFCARDRFGVKPFNYTFSNQRFIFGSEIKSILSFEPALKRPNYNAIANFCRESVGAQNEETWFENILRLPPAHYMVVNTSGHQLNRYWDYPEAIDHSITWEDALTQYRNIFDDAIKLRMRSDVPVGATLSSGIDSSTIVAAIHHNYKDRLHTYTASFPGNSMDEFSVVEKFTANLNVDAKRIVVQYEHYMEELEQLIYHLESGHSSPAIFPLHHVTKEAAKDITVFLEGQGADEALAGYISTIFFDYFLDLVLSLRWKKAINELKAFKKTWSIKNSILLFIRTNAAVGMRRKLRGLFGTDKIYAGALKNYKPYEVRNSNRKFDSMLNKKLWEQHQTGLVNLLHYGDAISMMHSLESRLPFMDYRLVEFAFRMPLEYKINNGLGKFIHRESVKDILPDYILNNPLKLGFPSPLKDLFNTQKEGGPLSVLLSDSLKTRNILSQEVLLAVVKEHTEGKKDHSRFLFRLLGVEIWFRLFIDSAVTPSKA